VHSVGQKAKGRIWGTCVSRYRFSISFSSTWLYSARTVTHFGHFRLVVFAAYLLTYLHAVYRRSLPASHISRQQTETAIRHSRRPRGQLRRHALRLPCIRCGGPYGMEPAAGAFTGTRDSRPLQDGIKDLSSLHPATVSNCLTRRALVMTLFMLRRVRNCRRCYCYY